MKINDNGYQMRDGEQWWVAWPDYNNWDKPKIRIAKVVGDRPYQQLTITGEYPSEVWVIKRATDHPKVCVVETETPKSDGHEGTYKRKDLVLVEPATLDATAFAGTLERNTRPAVAETRPTEPAQL